ncbi:MAG: ScyD/ScyE family protein [Candidatus Acidiferrales bacterium]
MKPMRCLAAFTFFALLASGWSWSARAQGPSVNVSIFATGLNNPRGLKFGPDGYLYVAEGGYPSGVQTEAPAGLGGDCSAGGNGPGDYYGSTTGSRISKIDAHGNVTTYVDNLPSSEAGGLASGVADVAFIGKTMYAVLAGAGCSHGVPSIPNGVIRVNPDHSWTMIADLGAFLRTHPVANPTDPITGDFEPDGTWYSMIGLRGALYAIEPNHGEMDKITTDGKITRVIDISASQGHVVPTVVGDHGVFYVSNLGRFDPEQLNTQSVFQITPSGQLKVVANGLSKVLGLAFDGHNRLYVLETSYSTSDPGPEPGTGRLIRILPNGKQEVLIDSTSGALVVPTGITFGPDGALYISNIGYGAPPLGAGQIIKVQFTD